MVAFCDQNLGQCNHILHLVQSNLLVYFFFLHWHVTFSEQWQNKLSRFHQICVHCVTSPPAPLPVLWSGTLRVVVFITHTCNCGTVKPDLSHSAADMYLVESLVPKSNPNSEDGTESEDTSVAKKGRKYCFCEELVLKFDWLRSQRDEFHELQILQSIPATCGEHEICCHYTVKT